jgi:hypothetical protein
MSKCIQLICAWCGPATVIVALTGWLIAGVLPIPLGPSSTTSEVVDFYHNTVRVPAGLLISFFGLCLAFPLFALISVFMIRMEGRSPLLSLIQLITAAITGVFLTMPILLMAVLSFRPDRSPELTVTLNDIAWLLFITPIAPFMIQNFAIGTAILTDRRGLLPRWAGYLNFWVALAFVPDVLAFFFHSGPFSWRGIFVFWLALAAYSAFLIGMGVVLHIAVRNDTTPVPEADAVTAP